MLVPWSLYKAGAPEPTCSCAWPCLLKVEALLQRGLFWAVGFLFATFLGEVFLPTSSPFVSQTTQSPVVGCQRLEKQSVSRHLGKLGMCGSGWVRACFGAVSQIATSPTVSVRERWSSLSVAWPSPWVAERPPVPLGGEPWIGQGFKKPDHRASLLAFSLPALFEGLHHCNPGVENYHCFSIPLLPFWFSPFLLLTLLFHSITSSGFKCFLQAKSVVR